MQVAFVHQHIVQHFKFDSLNCEVPTFCGNAGKEDTLEFIDNFLQQIDAHSLLPQRLLAFNYSHTAAECVRQPGGVCGSQYWQADPGINSTTTNTSGGTHTEHTVRIVQQSHPVQTGITGSTSQVHTVFTAGLIAMLPPIAWQRRCVKVQCQGFARELGSLVNRTEFIADPNGSRPCTAKLSGRCPAGGFNGTSVTYSLDFADEVMECHQRCCPCILVFLYPALYHCSLVSLYHCSLEACLVALYCTMYPCILVSLYPCILVSVYPCIRVSVHPCILVYLCPCIVPCILVSLYRALYLCILVSLYPCILVSL